jgi:hypothetical protein
MKTNMVAVASAAQTTRLRSKSFAHVRGRIGPVARFSPMK